MDPLLFQHPHEIYCALLYQLNNTRPSYIEAARPDKAEPMYNQMIDYFKNKSELNIQTGRFGAMMNVHLLNDGPVTLILEK